MKNNRQLLPAVAAAIFNQKGEILLQKRSDVQQWGLISGHVEFGESVEAAVLREIFEETGQVARVVRLIGVYSSPESQLYSYPDKDVHYITTYFEAAFTADFVPGYSNSETQELRFFAPDSLPSRLAQMHHRWLADALQKNEVFIR